MEVNKEDRSAVIGIGTYIQHFTRELCTEKEYEEAKHVYKIIGTTEETGTGKLMVRLEKRFGDFHDLFIPAEDLFKEVDREKYPYIKQKYDYEEVIGNEPKYPLHPEDGKYLPIDRYEEGKYKEGDIISIQIATKTEYHMNGLKMAMTMDESTKKSLDNEFRKVVEKGLAFILLPPSWYDMKQKRLAIANGITATSMIEPNDIVGVVTEILDKTIKIRILHPGPFNRLVADKKKIRAHRRIYKDPKDKESFKNESIKMVCYDLDLPSHYVINP